MKFGPRRNKPRRISSRHRKGCESEAGMNSQYTHGNSRARGRGQVDLGEGRRMPRALGLIEGLTKVFYPEASNTVIFVIMAIVLLIKPAGLFGTQK